MDWLGSRQIRIENKLAEKHLRDGQLVLFDVSSSYYTGRESPLIKRGYSRDHRKDRPQIVYGLYVVRSSVEKQQMDSERVVANYKSLAKVERAFRCLKTVDLSLRPISPASGAEMIGGKRGLRMAAESPQPYFGDYPPDFFDFIVIDDRIHTDHRTRNPSL